MIGATYGNFRIVERLGDGGMGSVYRAVDEMLDRQVAIKVLRPELARQKTLIERFRQEAIALARLSHPRITALHGLEKHGDDLLMIMEYVKGETLEAIVQRSGRLAWPRAAELCVAVLDALDHAHDKGVVHRDIKPANVMLSHTGAVKVMDFGIARMMGKNRQTQFGHAVGTPMYMAPEQLRGEEVDGRTDLYAVGAVLFELVTGRMAFEADSDYRLMMMQLNDPPPPPSSVVAEVPAVIDAIVVRAMAKRPVDRFADANEFARALEDTIASLGPKLWRAPSPPTRLAAEAMVVGATGDSAVVRAADRIGGGGETAEHSLGMAETRLVSPVSVSLGGAPAYGGPVPAYNSPAVEARLADAAGPRATPPTTRIGESGRSAPHATMSHGWTRDWRTFAATGVLLVVAGLGVRYVREALPNDDRGGDSTRVVVADTVRLPVVGDSAGLGAVRAVESANDLMLTAPVAVVGGVGGGGTVVADKKVLRKRVVTPPSAPDAPASGGSVTPAPTTPREETTRSSSVERGESEAEAAAAISAAIAEAAASLSGRNAGAAESLLGGSGIADQWIALMKEGRVSMSADGSPAVQVNGARATVEFGASVNVRSPFGANRRRSARFNAQLQRSGGRWRVTSLRPVGGVELR
ncbi:MAG: serine/threonine-protein kinase [Gemmatimonadaceae bacterium]|nr:serine/threonine-protein kinase [Gemmatimonadaceae bacterium]